MHSGGRFALSLLTSLGLLVPGWSGHTLAQTSHDGPVLVDDVTLITMESERAQSGRAVLIDANGRIAAIGASQSLETTAETLVLDASGLFLIPGLIDAHVHLTSKDDLDYLLSFGVTRIREARGNARFKAFRDSINAGTLRGPFITQGSPYVWDRGPALLANQPEDPVSVRALVRRFSDDGYDAIKLVDSYDADTTLAMMDEARSVNMPVFGHVPDDSDNFDWEWTAALGMQSIEHLDEVVNLAFENNPNPSEAQIEWFVKVAKDHGVAFGSIMGSMALRQHAFARMAAGEPPLPEATRQMLFDEYEWSAVQRFDRSQRSLENMDEDTKALFTRNVALMNKMLLRLTRSDVMVVPSTEGSLATHPAGASLRHELDLFVEAGLTPYEALRAATVYAARVLSIDDEEGMIKLGYRANVALVAKNPLDDLGALDKLVGLGLAGSWYNRTQLEALRRGH